MPRTHHYAVTTTWTGDCGTGTSGYRDFDRDHESVADGRPPLLLLLVAALSQCHMLWYLHLCAEAARCCFVANSVAFPVRHEPRVVGEQG